jgi:hypothetical protein
MRKAGSIVLIIAGLTACARVMPPSGGERDKEAPRIVETLPAQNATATDLAGTNNPVRIVFHETLSERSPREMVQVSPETGEVKADRDGNEIRVTMEGGWQANRIYRVTVLPGIVDRHGNARPGAYELVFSTGGTIVPNALGGLVTDRITGKAVVNARVEAIARADSTVYTTVTDTGGFFALRALPTGVYTTRVYSDQNRNRKLDPVEARASRDLTLGANDTIPVELTLMVPDTTPARLLRAEIRDSLQVRLSFDDYMDPSGSLPPMRVNAWQLPDSTLIAGGSVLTPRQFQRLRADTTRTAPGIAAPATTAADTTRELPINELVWVPPAPLRPNTRYRVSISGFRNLVGLPDGGGSVVVTSPAPARVPPTPAPRDTIRR